MPPLDGPAGGPRIPPWLTRGAIGIVLATFFSDVGHEMVTAVLPLYLTAIGLGPGALGLVEGVADLAFSLAKLGGGIVGQRLERKKPLTAIGYAITAVFSALVATASSAVMIGTFRVVAWIGRGFRSPLRDFLLADEVASTHYARAYGVERSADMLGAVAGPLLALALLWAGAPLPAVIAVSVVPALLSVVAIVALTRDRGAEEFREPPGSAGDAGAAAARLPRRFWLLLVGILVFGLGDFSRTFLIFLVADAVGGSHAPGAFNAGVLAYTAHNAISGLAAPLAGRLGDRAPKPAVLVAGYGIGVGTNAILALAYGSPAGLAFAVLGSGVYIAVEETLEKAVVADILPREVRTLGFGILACANAVGDMVSSLYVGWLLATGHAGPAFALAAVLGAAGALWTLAVSRSGLRAAS